MPHPWRSRRTQRAVQGHPLQVGRMNSKPASISVSERTAYHCPKRRRWPPRLKRRPSSSGHWPANGRYDPAVRFFRLSKDLNDTADRQLLLLLQPSATPLRRTGPYQTTHECPILADGALCRPMIALHACIRLLRYVRGRLRTISSWIPDNSPCWLHCNVTATLYARQRALLEPCC